MNKFYPGIISPKIRTSEKTLSGKRSPGTAIETLSAKIERVIFIEKKVCLFSKRN